VIAANAEDTDLVHGKELLACRVPTVIVSPFARGNPASPRVNSLLYDHTSVLKLIEWRWGLEPLTPRDASNEVGNLASALNFIAQDPSVPALPVIAEPPLQSCASGIISGSRGDGGFVIDTAKAIEVARTENSKGVGNESYDFYVLLKSERMAGWPLPAKLSQRM
jgi:phospholipase C